MNPIGEFYRIRDGLCVWIGYNHAVKVDCSSTAIRTMEGWVVVDPIPIKDSVFSEMLGGEPLAAIALTSGNHQREATHFKEQHKVPVYAPEAARAELAANMWVKEGDSAAGLRTLSVPGAALGEVAYLFEDILVFGDALINLDELCLLPEKYCEDATLLPVSLKKIVRHDFEIACFAHGLPILTQARQRITELVLD